MTVCKTGAHGFWPALACRSKLSRAGPDWLQGGWRPSVRPPRRSGLKIRFQPSNDKDLEKVLHPMLHLPADLAEVVERWDQLPDPVKMAVLALVRSVR